MPALSSAHQMLATQSPKTYSPSSPDALLPMRKLYYRSRLEAELIRLRSSASSDGQATHPARLGRLSDSSFTSYNKFRSAALSKLGFSDCSSTPLPLTIQARTGAEAEEAAFSRFACLWLLRTLLGPVIESYLVLDRYLYIQSRTDGQTKLRPVFDQSTGSLRNMAILLTK